MSFEWFSILICKWSKVWPNIVIIIFEISLLDYKYSTDYLLTKILLKAECAHCLINISLAARWGVRYSNGFDCKSCNEKNQSSYNTTIIYFNSSIFHRLNLVITMLHSSRYQPLVTNVIAINAYHRISCLTQGCNNLSGACYWTLNCDVLIIHILNGVFYVNVSKLASVSKAAAPR